MGFFQNRCARAVASRMYSVETIPYNQVGLVLGAPPSVDGTLSKMVRARLDLGLSLYRAQKVGLILISGYADHAQGNEVELMRDYILQHGLCPSRLWVDGGATRTWESMVRANHRWRLKSLTVVTNMFHLPRSLLLAERAGLNASGAVSFDPKASHRRLQVKRILREELSCVRAICEGFYKRATIESIR